MMKSSSELDEKLKILSFAFLSGFIFFYICVFLHRRFSALQIIPLELDGAFGGFFRRKAF